MNGERQRILNESRVSEMSTPDHKNREENSRISSRFTFRGKMPFLLLINISFKNEGQLFFIQNMYIPELFL